MHIYVYTYKRMATNKDTSTNPNAIIDIDIGIDMIMGMSIPIHVHMYIYICTYRETYIYIYGTPPQRSTKFNATTAIVGYFRLQDCPEVCWQNLGSRLKPIEPIEISIGTKIQDPRLLRGLP